MGEHLRKARIDKNLTQEETARMFKVTECCVTNWENEKAEPRIGYYKKILAFIGYYPFENKTKSLAARMLKYRRLNGITPKNLGKLVGVDATTIRDWEAEKHRPLREHREKLLLVIGK